MDSRNGKIRMSVEGDRISSLSNDLILKILGLNGIKHAVQTSVLSSRWRYIWTSISTLRFSSKDFRTLPKFSKFVKHVLSGRNNQIEMSSVNIAFHGKVSQKFVNSILNMILNNDFANIVHQLNITFSMGKYRIESPLSPFSSQSLKYLTLDACTCPIPTTSTYRCPITTTATWELPNLMTLHLHHVIFYEKAVVLFSNFPNLKNLTLERCSMSGSAGCFRIHHPRLSNLTLEDGNLVDHCIVVTPQLKNLTIRYYYGGLPPHLASLNYKCLVFQLILSADLLHLEKLDICISSAYLKNKANITRIFGVLQHLHSVKSLTLNLELIKELILHQPSPFSNLKSFKIYPYDVNLEEQLEVTLAMSPEVKSYLLDGSPGATFTNVSHEEIRAEMNVASARTLMKELKVLLDEWKEKSETNMATMHEEVEVKNLRVQPDTIMKSHVGERMARINERFKKGYKNTGLAYSMLRKIEIVLTKLPTSHRAKLQASFYSLYVEAETVIDIMVDDLKIQCDKKPRLYFDTASHPSSS